MSLTVPQMWEEYRYRLEERLGILCGDGYVDAGAVAIARAEADAWLLNIRKEQDEDKKKAEH